MNQGHEVEALAASHYAVVCMPCRRSWETCNGLGPRCPAWLGLLLPADVQESGALELEIGEPGTPYPLATAGAMLRSRRLDSEKLGDRWNGGLCC